MDKISTAILTVVGGKGMGTPISREELVAIICTHYTTSDQYTQSIVKSKLSDLLMRHYITVTNDRYTLTQLGLDFVNALPHRTPRIKQIDGTYTLKGRWKKYQTWLGTLLASLIILALSIIAHKYGYL